MKSFYIPIRLKLTEMEFLRSVFSTKTRISKDGDVIKFIINNSPEDEIKFEEWRTIFGFTMRELPPPKHDCGISWYNVRKKK